MKLWIKILLGVTIVGALVFVYWKFLYFPHAKILRSDASGIVWGNNSAAQGKMFSPNQGKDSGDYGHGYFYEISSLPNRQFRFIVYKSGRPNDPVVDNIFSFDNLPVFLTK